MDVSELLKSKNLEYISSGRDYKIRCLNPDHEDKNPSMNIDKISGLFKCVSCGFSGDIYKYFKINNEKFISIKIQKVRELAFKLLNTKSLPLPLDATRIKIDYRDIKAKTLQKFGAFTSDSLKNMEGRIIFPIYDINNKIIAFNGRYMYSDLEPRYKIYPEHVSLPLYPAKVDGINNSIILVEGIFDMLNLHDKGLTNAVCTFGTAFGSVKKYKKKLENIDKLLNYKYQGIDTVYVMYDGDTPGRDAANNLVNFIKPSFIADTIELEDGQDPGSLTSTEVKQLYNILYG